ncbi:MAG TPA: hypothetical protein VMR41_00155 [Patescibacteria group bacterium]|nr:hypothetical protein [Patescibacteria group bacterium]
MKKLLKNKAVILRKYGLSYSEILTKVPVAKSTLSLWLRNVELPKKQRYILTERRQAAIKKGWETWRKARIEKTNRIKQQAKSEITNIDSKNLWLMGIMLYWAEGTKQKDYNVDQGVCFSNSDPLMIKLFLKWLESCLEIPRQDILFDIYIHEYRKVDSKDVVQYWARSTGFPVSEFGRIYYKKHKLINNRRNIGVAYKGQLRIRVRRSTDLNRKITGWIEGICSQCRVV